MATDFILYQLMCGSEHKPIRYLYTSGSKPVGHGPLMGCSYSKGPENFRNFGTSLDNAASVWFLLFTSVIAEN
jgi:hypothetical protein